MLVRPKLLKVTKNLAAIRATHIVVSVLAGVLLVAHISYLFAPPNSISLDLGYVSVIVATGVWLTGTAFLERLRDALFFHGTLSMILVGLVVAHAATSNVNIPSFLSEAMLGCTFVIMLANAVYHLRRAAPRPQQITR